MQEQFVYDEQLKGKKKQETREDVCIRINIAIRISCIMKQLQ